MPSLESERLFGAQPFPQEKFPPLVGGGGDGDGGGGAADGGDGDGGGGAATAPAVPAAAQRVKPPRTTLPSVYHVIVSPVPIPTFSGPEVPLYRSSCMRR